MNRPDAYKTWYGMTWVPEDAESVIEVHRMATINGRAVIQIVTYTEGIDKPKAEVQIIVSKKGNTIRTYPVFGNVGQSDL